MNASPVFPALHFYGNISTDVTAGLGTNLTR